LPERSGVQSDVDTRPVATLSFILCVPPRAERRFAIIRMNEQFSAPHVRRVFDVCISRLFSQTPRIAAQHAD
jgi:hypothetical protein